MRAEQYLCEEACLACPAVPHATHSMCPRLPAPRSGKPEAAAGKPPLAPAGGLFGSGVSAAVPPASIFGGLAPAGGAGAGSAAGGAGSVGGFVGFRGFCSGAASAANSGGGGLFTVPSTGTLGSSFTTGGGATEDDEGDEEQHDTEPSVGGVAVGI